jgi:hypothetical protein
MSSFSAIAMILGVLLVIKCRPVNVPNAGKTSWAVY